MKKTNLLVRGSALTLALFSAMPAFAQSAPADDAATAADEGTIVVTGSRIRQPNLESANPIAVVTGAEIFETGGISVGDLLNELPQLRSTFSQQNSTRFLGTRGLNLLDLRGLGTQRTLVLQNGRRHVGSDVLSNGVSVDTNTIPSDLVERIDIVTGGASAVYGSDAIAGVVNFILKDDFEGIQMRGQSGISRYGDAGNQFVSLTAGKNFADGRGNVAINLEYAHSSDFYASGRPNLRQNDAFVIVDADPAGSPNGAAGGVDRYYFRDIRSATISLGGMVTAFPNSVTAPCGAGDGTPFSCAFQFQPDGTLVRQTGTRVGIGPNGSFIGGNGMTGREGQLIALSPDLKRYSANLIAHFEVSPAFVPFIEAKYVRSEAVGSQSGPFFSQGTTTQDPGGRERVRLDNPFLSTQARTLLTQQFLATNVNANTGAALSAAALATQQAAINAGTFRFGVRRNWVEFGTRDEEITRETYRAVIGARGDFNDDWNYEVFANYGEHKEKNLIKGNINVQRYLLGLDTTRDTAGNIVCRSQLNQANRNGTISYVTGNPLSAGDDPRLGADIDACVPINPFGEGSVTDAMRKYVLVDSMATGKITQLNVGGFVAGDTSEFFNLPGGPVSFSVGGEYRRETLKYDLDDVTQAGYAFYNAIPSFDSPSFEVKEVYGEMQLPLLKDLPFAKELTLRANGRISDYKGTAGTTYTYGGEVMWKPIEDIGFRGTYARAVRAPNLSDLYSAQGQNFAPLFVDPCSAANLATGSANRVKNCQAAGAPAGYDYRYIASLEIQSGGNPDLKAEKSDSYTFGVLLQPRFIPGLSLSVDYYKITVDDVITAPSAQQIANACYDLPDLSNPFCALFKRAGVNGNPVPADYVPFQILEGDDALIQLSQNYASLKARGIDAQLDYRYTDGDWTFTFGGLYTRVLQRDEFLDPSNPAFKNRILGELGDPKNQVNVNVSAKYKNITLGYQFRWIDKMYLNTYEDFNELNGLPPQNLDYASVQKYPSVAYVDLRAAVDVSEGFNFYAGVDNLFNRKPPYGLTGVGAGSGIYDNRGQYFYAGIVAKF